MTEVLVGFGSNIEPEANLRSALDRLRREFGPLRVSDVYRSPALGFTGPDFLNLVALFDSNAGPAAVEAVLSAVERAGGRDDERSGSRTLDLDLLLYGACVDAGQRLPREDVLLYPFVLAPLVDLVPDLRHPVTGVRLADAWAAKAACERPELTRVELAQARD